MDMSCFITMKRPEKGGRASEEDLKDSPGCNKELCSKFDFSFLSEVILCPSLYAWRKSNNPVRIVHVTYCAGKVCAISC